MRRSRRQFVFSQQVELEPRALLSIGIDPVIPIGDGTIAVSASILDTPPTDTLTIILVTDPPA